MSAATAPAPWWRTAPNPPCVSWCTSDHADNDFADNNGGMLCTRPIAETDKFTVEVQRHTGTNYADTDFEAFEPEVWLTASDDRMTAAEAAAFAAALTEASTFLSAQVGQR